MKTIISFATRFSLLLDKHDQRIETIGNDESTVVISIIESSNHRTRSDASDPWVSASTSEIYLLIGSRERQREERSIDVKSCAVSGDVSLGISRSKCDK